ncbi:MAG: multiheme c-type cytochrome [Planctomycetota bacterium]
MTRPSPAFGLLLALGLLTLVATLAQCGGDRTAPGAGQTGDRSTTPNGAAPDRAEASDPASETPAKAPAAPPPPDAIRLLISGTMLGRLEPCGCASGQLGGLARRVQHIGEQRNYDLLIEGGDLVEGHSELDTFKLLTAASILFQSDSPYDAVGVGPNDLAMAFDEWTAFLTGAPVVATNLGSEDPSWPGKSFLDKQIREHSVRIGSLLLSKPAALAAEGARVTFTEPAAAWSQAFAETSPETRRIVLLHGNDAAIRAAIPTLDPKPDLAIGVDPGFLEPDGSATLVAEVPLVFAGIRGRVLLDARLWRSENASRVACERVPLTGSRTVPGGGGDPDVKDAILQHRRDVAEYGILANLADKKPTPNGAEYIGTASCAGCHPTAMKAWESSKHAHAWQTLVDAENDPKRYGWPVTKYPDCVGCHVVGYEQKSGFRSFEETPLLASVGCERCHGPGSEHRSNPAANPMGIIGGELASKMCTQCHDFEQSPDFLYLDRWKEIAHGLEPHMQAGK